MSRTSSSAARKLRHNPFPVEKNQPPGRDSRRHPIHSHQRDSHEDQHAGRKSPATAAPPGTSLTCQNRRKTTSIPPIPKPKCRAQFFSRNNPMPVKIPNTAQAASKDVKPHHECPCPGGHLRARRSWHQHRPEHREQQRDAHQRASCDGHHSRGGHPSGPVRFNRHRYTTFSISSLLLPLPLRYGHRYEIETYAKLSLDVRFLFA